MHRLRLLLAILLFAWAAHAETVAELGQPHSYISDFAGIFTPAEHDRLELICTQFHDQSHAQIYVVTVHSLNGEGVAPYANDLFHTWKIGEAKTDRGLLLLLSMKEHERRIEVGYGFEGALNDGKAGDIGRAMVPDLRAEKYEAATEGALRAMIADVAPEVVLKVEPVVSQPAVAASDEAAPIDGGRQTIVGLVIAFSFLFIPFVILLVYLAARRAGHALFNWPLSQSGPSSTDSSSSGSSFSNSSSSSDDSGDGGDSGGGGADGTW